LETARDLHQKLKLELKAKNFFLEVQTFGYMAPTPYDDLMFKRYGRLVRPDQSPTKIIYF
jgi:hypothetical protein